MNDPYVLPNGVLRNRLGITDAATLTTAETDITRARLLQVDEHPPAGDFDLVHLRRFHAAIFSDLYDWAGELRTVDIATLHETRCDADLFEPVELAAKLLTRVVHRWRAEWACVS